MKNMTGAIYVAGALDYETRKRVSVVCIVKGSCVRCHVVVVVPSKANRPIKGDRPFVGHPRLGKGQNRATDTIRA